MMDDQASGQLGEFRKRYDLNYKGENIKKGKEILHAIDSK